MPVPTLLRKLRIVSGGQTGADRAALDWAIAHSVPHGGWCPRGRLAEDGVIDARYQLSETPKRTYSQRTEWNVRDADATVVFSIARRLRGGTALTAALARAVDKPLLELAADAGRDAGECADILRRFLDENSVRVLNVAGPRASTEPGVYHFVTSVFDELWRRSESGQDRRP